MKLLYRLGRQIKSDLLPLLRKGFWAVGDQTLFSATNFLLNVLLARWLGKEAYGVFAVAYSVFIFVMVVHSALLIEPMLVFGPGRYKGRFIAYLRALVWGGHGWFALVSSVLLACGGVVLQVAGSPQLAAALYGFALVQPFISLLWMMRRATYVRDEQHLAVGGGVCYLLIVGAGLYGLRYAESATVFTALLVMGGASLVSIAYIAMQLRGASSAQTPSGALFDRTLFADLTRKHWAYGRWSVGTGALMWVPENVYVLLLPIWGGYAQSGAFKALMNLVRPMFHSYTAFSHLLIPELVKAHAEGRLQRMIALTTAGFVACAVAYWLVIGAFSADVIRWLYGDDYGEYADLMWLLGALPIAVGTKVVLEAALRALEKPDLLFWAYLASTVLTLTLGLGLLALYGIAGAAVGLILSSLVVTAGALYFLSALRSQPPQTDQAEGTPPDVPEKAATVPEEKVS